MNGIMQKLREEFGSFQMVEANLKFAKEAKSGIEKRIMQDKELPTFYGTTVVRVNYEDGCKVYFEDGSFVICRFSGTEPLLRIFAEAENKSRAEAYINAFKTMLGL